MSMRINLAIADDHEMIRIGLERVFSLIEGMVVVARYADATELLRADLHVVDVLLLDLNMPGGDGIAVIASLTERFPDLKIVVFSLLPEESFAPRALAAGASAYLNKGQSPEEVIAAVQAVVAYGTYVPAAQEEAMLALEADRDVPLHQSLSQREFEILLLVAAGCKPVQIAERLELRVGTVSTHVHRVKRKLGARSLGDLVAYAHRHRLVG